MMWLYDTILYQPIYNLLIFFYNYIPGHDLGIAIIAITLVIKLILYPLSSSSIKSQKALQEIQPRLEEIKKKFKDNKEQLAQETLKLYKDTKVNPFASCLPLLIQIPILIAVYQVFRSGLISIDATLLYSFVQNPGTINHIFLGFINLAATSWPLALLAGVGQFFQTKMLMTKQVKVKDPAAKDESVLTEMNKSMTYMMPVVTVFIGISLPAGLTLYWVVMTLLTIAQQYVVFHFANKNKETLPPASNKVIDIAPSK